MTTYALRYYLRRAAVLVALFMYGPQCFATLPAAQIRPARPQGWSAAVSGPLLTLQQLDATTGRQILALKKLDGTTVCYVDIAGDGVFNGFLEPGAFATGALPAVTASNAGAVAMDTTANAMKYVNNAGSWVPFQGTGTITGSGTLSNLARWTGASSLGNGLVTDDAAHQVQINATPNVSAVSALLALGTEPAVGSANGNVFGINAAGGFTGNLMDAEVGGVARFSIDYTGKVTIPNLTANTFLMADGGKVIVSGTSTDLTASGTALNLATQAGVAPGTYTNSTVTVNSKGVVTGVSSGSVSGISGSGTVNTIPKFTASAQLGNSTTTDDGTKTTIGDNATLAGSLTYKTTNQTTTYTAANVTTILCDTTGGGFTVTLPAASASVGLIYQIIKTDATGNTVTVAGAGADKINGAATATTSTQYGQIQIVCGNNPAGTPAWWNYVSAASTLQAVMTAGNSSTVAQPMILSPTTGTSIQATTADYNTAASVTSQKSGAALNLVQTRGTGGGAVQNALSVVRSGGGSDSETSAVIFANENAGGAGTVPLLDLQSAGVSKFSVTKAGVAQVPALANASGNYLGVDASGNLTDTTGTPITSNPGLDTVLGVSNTASHDILLSAGNTYKLASDANAYQHIYTSVLNMATAGGAGGAQINFDTTGGVFTGSQISLGSSGAGYPISILSNDTMTLAGGTAAKAISFNSHITAVNGDTVGQAATSASTSVAVTFGTTYSAIPKGVIITPLGDPTAAGVYWVSGIGTSGFTINTKNASTLTFSWVVIQ